MYFCIYIFTYMHKLIPYVTEVSNKKAPWLFELGDEILPSNIGILISDCKGPYQPGFNGFFSQFFTVVFFFPTAHRFPMN